MGLIKKSAPTFWTGTGESAPFIPEKFAFDKVIRYGRTIDIYKRSSVAATGKVNGPRQDLFACTALPHNQNG